jgi:signal transduction histidine kinase/ActR/RegA family two-component response regulator/HPt (histidine-containing phosphotransfer) domain-containing protein
VFEIKGNAVQSPFSTELTNFSDLTTVLDLLHLPTVLVDNEGRIKFCNQAFSQLIKADRRLDGALIGQQVFDVLELQSGSADALSRVNAAIVSNTAADELIEIRDPLGSVGWYKVQISFSAVSRANCLSFTDVSSLKTFESAASKIKAQNAILFDSVSAGLGEWFFEENLISLGPRVAMMIGDEPDLWVKQPVSALLARCHPDDQAQLEREVDQLRSTSDQKIHTELRLKHNAGHWIAVLARGHVKRRSLDNAAESITIVFMDITQFRHENSRWMHRAQLSVDWFWSTNPQGFLTEVSKQMAEQLGGLEADLMKKPLIEVMRLAGVHGAEEVFMALAGKVKVHKGMVLRMDRPGNTPIWVELDASPRYSYLGKFEGYEGVARHVTKKHLQELELLEAKQLAEESNRSKSAFLAAMSHEIRTPMNGVLGMAEMLATTELDEDQAESLGIIRRSATHLLSLIDGILDFSKLEADRVDIEEREVNIEDLIYGTTDSLMPLANSKGIRLRSFSDPLLPTAMLDETRLRQILNNLVGNAIKFSASETNRQGAVYLRAVSNDAGMLKISVSDNGIGISRNHLSTVFNAFNQAEVSTTRRFGGTGLGLAISKKLVDLMGGNIEVDSVLGQGTTFTVFLPLRQVSKVPSCDELLRSKHCVIVGDASIENDDLKMSVALRGATVRLEANVSAAYESLNTVERPTFYLHNLRGVVETSYVKAINQFVWPSAVAHILITEGTRKSLRMIEEKVACVDWGRPSVLVNAINLLSQDRTQIPDTEYAAKKRLIGIGMERKVERLSPLIKVLVAEDDLINQKVISKQLAHLGVSADFASTGREALDLWLANKNYSLILTDLHMPEMDGYELTRRIRETEGPDEHVAIAALTANAVTGEAFEAYKVGIDVYLTKPIRLADLSVAIATFANLPELDPVADPKSPPQLSDDGAPKVVNFNSSTLFEVIGDDYAMVCELIKSYTESLEKDLDSITSALIQLDAKTCTQLGHRLKSSSRSVGALRLGDIFSAIELGTSIVSRQQAFATCAELTEAFDAFKRDSVAGLADLEKRDANR